MIRFKILLICTLFFTISANSQSIGKNELAGQNNPIITTVPFLIIAPDSKSSAMGETGVATKPDVYSQHWNNAKYAFMEENLGVGISFIPWLRNLGITDIRILYATGYFKLSDRQTISGGLKYFSLGEIQMTDNSGSFAGNINPNEWAIDGGYALKMTDKISGGIAFRFIYSDLSQGADYYSNKGIAGAADIGFYYHAPLVVDDKDGELAAGFQISNIGTKISYSDDRDPEFIPMNLRIGARYSYELDDYNSLTATIDFSKYLVPTPPIYKGTSDTILYGKSPDISVASSIFRSFTDAPGGFKEELQEVITSVGIEYDYREQFAIRAGYFHENENKGNRKFLTVGFGLKLNVMGLDISYLIPTVGNSPLANTVRFSLTFDLK